MFVDLMHGLRQALIRPVEYLLRAERRHKRLLIFALDLLLCISSILLAFSLRVGALAFPIEPVLLFAAIAVPLFVPIFAYFRVYSHIFRFAGGRTVSQLGMAVAVYALLLVTIFMIVGVEDVPRTVAILHPMIFFGFTSFSRLAIRHILLEIVLPDRSSGRISRVLIYGAGSAGRQLALALRNDHNVLALAFVDDDERLANQSIDGLRVYPASKLESVIATRSIDTVLLALPGATRKRRSEIVEELQPLKVHVRILPDMQQIIGGRVSVSDLRDIQIEDLLGRDPVIPHDLLLGRAIVDKTVLVTGGGGSIGSELCRQVVAIGARRIVMFDVSEYALYRLERELRQIAGEKNQRLELYPILGSVQDRDRLHEVFQTLRPDTVFHAAAYKHVPLVETNPVEGMRNNVLGTYEVVHAAIASGVRDFTFVSTDKAVRPTSLMGASKRCAEQIVQAFAEICGDARFSIVRFGNVLGSSGSVVPLFREQIEKGGPITVTHREVTRYFMTIPEAAQLVIQAGGLARGGEVFVLDMGKPVKIMNLARAMVELSGLTVRSEEEPDGDIEIIEVGLRPGEKLYEELLIGENPEKTTHPRIMKARETYAPIEQIEASVRRLREARLDSDIIDIFQGLEPDFQHRRDNELRQTKSGAARPGH